MNKISRRGFFAIPVTSATTAIAASAAMAQPVVRTIAATPLVSYMCKCGRVMYQTGNFLLTGEEYMLPNKHYCCNSECDLFHVPFEMPKIEVTEARPVRYNR